MGAYINDANSWSDTRILIPGAVAPTFEDDVIITIDSPTLSIIGFFGLFQVLNCNNLTFEGPTEIKGGGLINVYGELTYNAGNTDTSFTGGWCFYNNGYVDFKGTSVTSFVGFGDGGVYYLVNCPSVGGLYTSVANATLYLNSNLVLSFGIGYTTISSSGNFFIYLQGHTITCMSNYIAFDNTDGTGKVIMKVADCYLLLTDGCSLGNIDFEMGGINLSLYGSASVNDLYIPSGSVLSIMSGGTLYLNDFIGGGIDITLNSTIPGSPHYLSKPNGSITVNFWSIQDSYAGGGATFSATNSMDEGGNSGWFINYTATNVYTYVSGAWQPDDSYCYYSAAWHKNTDTWQLINKK